jgi:hypothetical protein
MISEFPELLPIPEFLTELLLALTLTHEFMGNLILRQIQT